MEKERYEFREVENELDLNDTDIVVADNEKGGIIRFNNICKLLNQQDARIKELEEENQKLYQQIVDLNKENNKLREFRDDILKVQAEPYQFYKENQQLKKSQNQKVIEELQKVLNNFRNRPTYFDVARQELCLIDQDKQFVDFINSQIKELRGEENEHQTKTNK